MQRKASSKRQIYRLNKITTRSVEAPREYSTERTVPNPAQPGVRPATLQEKGTGRG